MHVYSLWIKEGERIKVEKKTHNRIICIHIYKYIYIYFFSLKIII